MAADDAQRRIGGPVNTGARPDRPVLRPPALMFGVPIADVTMPETISTIAALVDDGRSSGRTHQISTVNVDFLVNAINHPDVASILQGAALCLPDGMPVVWASHLLGMPLRERVAGADLVPLLVEASGVHGWHIHVFGSVPEVAEAAKSLLRERYPRARFSVDAGPMIDDVTDIADDVLDGIAATGADILCVALGNPKQERFIAHHAHRLGIPVMIGVGGSLDMLVGKRRRAPAWMRAIGLEWVVRAAQEPRRLGRRYAHDIKVFCPALAREWARNRRRRRGAGIRVVDGDDGGVHVSLTGDAVLSDNEWFDSLANLSIRRRLVVHTPDSLQPRDAAVAQLVGLAAHVRHSAGSVAWPSANGRQVGWLRDVQFPSTLVGLDGDR